MADEIWQQAASQILRALRGRRSQTAWSRRLGYRSNVACEWEAGRRVPTAAETLRACERTGIDLAAAFSAFEPACADALFSAGELRIDRYILALLGASTISELSSRSGLSRYAISRFVRGQARPRLHDFLRLVEAITGRASDLVALLVDIEQVPALRAIQQSRAAAKRIAFDHPWSEAVMRVLETEQPGESYVPGSIGRRLGLASESEAQLLQALEQAGLIRFEGGTYQPLGPLTVDTASHPEDFIRLRAHWSEVAAARSHSPRPSDFQGYNLVSASRADIERVREVLRRAFREIRGIVAASEPAQAVALVNLHLLTWDDNEPQREET